jgi:hypothetical protein
LERLRNKVGHAVLPCAAIPDGAQPGHLRGVLLFATLTDAGACGMRGKCPVVTPTGLFDANAPRYAVAHHCLVSAPSGMCKKMQTEPQPSTRCDTRLSGQMPLRRCSQIHDKTPRYVWRLNCLPSRPKCPRSQGLLRSQ